jgi:hypothetical protein
VLVYHNKNSSQVYDAFAVQLQSCDRCSTYRRPSDDQGKIPVPGKMIAPTVLRWVKQRGRDACEWVYGFRKGVFQVIAALAGERKIGRRTSSAKDARYDVLN